MYHFRKYEGFLISKVEEQILEEIYENLSQDFIIKYNPEFIFDFKKFGAFNHISVINPFLCFDVSKDSENFQIIAVNIQYNFIGGKHGDSLINENQIWGLKKLDKDFGNIFIRDENIYDKIAEIFQKIEIDFKENAEFSKRYFVITDNETQTRISLNQNMRKLFCEIPKKENFIFEISNNYLLMGNRKPIDKINVNQIVNFLKNKI